MTTGREQTYGSVERCRMHSMLAASGAGRSVRENTGTEQRITAWDGMSVVGQ